MRALHSDKYSKITKHGINHTRRRFMSLLLCICMVIPMMSTIALSTPAAEESNEVDISWANISEKDTQAGVIQKNEGGICTWDVSGSTKRYLDVPVQINVATNQEFKITLPGYIIENFRNKSDKAEISMEAIRSFCNEIEQNEDGKVVLHFKNEGTGGHASFQIPYRFDCWRVESDKKFIIQYAIQVGEDEETAGELTGKIKTGFGFEIVNDYVPGVPDTYFSNDYGRDNGYSLNAFGGADRIMSYIQNWSSVYEKYFNQPEFDADPDGKDGYIYDIAPFFVRPSGQQPYDISGTVTVEKGEILGGVYMMDSRVGSDKPWKMLTDTDEKNETFTFRFGHEEKFDRSYSDESLIDKVVTGNLTEEVDNQHYTLYFLVRYKIEDLDGKEVAGGKAYTLKAKLDLAHTGVDEPENIVTNEKDQVLYRGPITDSQIYDAYYTYFLENQQDALSTLDKAEQAALDFEADFFCFNEARDDFNKKDPNPYRLEAVIDLLYLTDQRPYQESEQLQKDDYRFSQFSLSLVDAPGNWSQNWYYEDRAKDNPADDEVWNERRPNIGWPEETWGKPNEDGYSNVYVYGSESHDGNQWTLIKAFDVNDIWAKDKGRYVKDERYNGSNKHTLSTNKNYVRLKVVYDSRWTTALRLGYQIELLNTALDHHPSLQSATTMGLTSWFNYFGYTKDPDNPGKDNSAWSADTDNMNIDAYYKSDSQWDFTWTDDEGNEKTYDYGTVEQARQYDNLQADKMDFASNFNTKSYRYDKTYSMRDYVRILLGRTKDQAGMLVTQALYNSNGSIVGNNQNSTQLNGGSFSKEKTVTNVSEIVYSISGGITNGALNKGNLDKRRQEEKGKNAVSPFTSLKMRYYVLLPEGFILNRTAVSPHYSINEQFLSPTPSFYDDSKATGREDTVVTSASNIPAWKEVSDYGALSEMKWNEAGTVKVNETLTNGRLVVFDRELVDQTLDEVFNLHGGTETYFWGRGLTFSAIPEKGTGEIRTSDYTTHFWCQYLDKDGTPLSLNNFEKKVEDVKENDLKNALKDTEVSKDTLLYIPSKFHNDSPVGIAISTISIESNNLDENGDPIQDKNDNYVLQFDKPYSYKIEYSSPKRSDKNVVLWTNIEEKNTSKPQYRGTVTGVDLSALPKELRSKVKVYVKTDDFFDPTKYIGTGESAASQEWLKDPTKDGWQEINPDSDLSGMNVKAIAFSFGDFVFNKTDEDDIMSATVRIKMEPPKREGDYLKLDGQPEKTFDAISRLYLSDSQDGDQNGCAKANEVPVSVTVRSETGSLTVEKQIHDDDKWEVDKDFTFTVTLTADETNGLKPEDLTVTKYKKTKDETETSEDITNTVAWNATTETDGKTVLTAELTLRHGEQFVITGIPYQTAVKVQESNKNGYHLEYVTSTPLGSSPSDPIHHPEDDSVSGQITEQNSQQYWRFVNAKPLVLPLTGSSGNKPFYLLGAAFIISGILFTGFYRKRRVHVK